MPFVSANGVELYYERSGTGERLLVISGTGGDLRRTRVGDAAVFSSFDLVQYDQRGLGRSGVPEGPYSMADYANDAAALLDAVEWDDCLVVGVSFGGMVAQELAIRHPHRLRRLVLACTSAGGAGGASYPLHELVGLAPDDALSIRLQLIDTRWDAAWRAANPDTVKLFAENFQLARPVDGTASGPLLQLEARRRHDTASRLAQIRCPTIVCAGRYDGIAPLPNSEFLAGAIPGARLAVFDGGHAFFMQDPAALPVIAAFLRDEDPGGAGAS